MKQRGQQNSLAPPPTLVAPKFPAAAPISRRPGNVGKGPRIEAPPPLNVPSAQAPAAAPGLAQPPVLTKPRSGSLSMSGSPLSPRQKLPNQPLGYSHNGNENLGSKKESYGEKEDIHSRTIRANSVAPPVRPKIEPALDQSNVPIPISAPVVKKKEPFNFAEGKVNFDAKFATELNPEKEVLAQCLSVLVEDILRFVNK